MDASALFDAFVSASTFRTIQQTFLQLCLALEIDSSNGQHIYKGIRQLKDWKAEKLWKLLDKRVNQKEYQHQKAGDKLTTLIIGAGPCGLRMAIECALLGNRVVVVEQREKFSRNNVLHLWEFVIHDIKALGAKIFYPKFCTGSIEHISIRQLQCILLKVALCFGVQVHEGIVFKEIVFPCKESNSGFKALFEPSRHILSEMEFDILIGADGKRNTVPGFRRDELRGKLAIAITANFINKKTSVEENVPEISGVAYIFNQAFFKEMYETTGVDLENIVYYKDETHYFVMCAKKHSLLDMGVLKKDCDDAITLLSPNNLDKEALCAYAVKAANFATRGALPCLEFAENHRGDKDIAAFDFTSLYSAKHSVRLVENNGKRLLMGIVGDSLHEPFWPTGSGCARGFLGVLDTAWLIRSLGLNQKGPLEMIAERESVYRLLTQVTKDNMHKMINKYTIDPRTRYLHPDLSLEPDEVVSLVYSDNPRSLPVSEPLPLNSEISAHSSEIVSIPKYSLWKFCCHVLMNFKLKITDFGKSWNDGLALGGLIAKFAPSSLDYFNLLTFEDVHERLQACFDVAESIFKVSIPCTPSEWEFLSDDKRTQYIAAIVNIIRQDITFVQQCLITPRSLKRRIAEKPRPRAARRATQPIEKLASDLLESFKGDDVWKKRNTEFDTVKRYERLHRQESDPSSRCSEDKIQAQDRKFVQEAFNMNDFIKKDRMLKDEQGHFLQKPKTESTQLDIDLLDGIGSKLKKNVVKRSIAHDSDDSAESCSSNHALSNDLNVYEKENELKNINSELLKRHSAPVMVSETLNIHRQTFCDLCGKVVYLAERIQVEAVFIHKNCFRCSFCSQPLRMGEYGKDKELDYSYPKKFFCNVHLRVPLKEKISQIERINRKKVRLSAAVPPMPPVFSDKSIDNSAIHFHHTLFTPKRLKESRSIISPISELRSEDVRTPERAEFGNHMKKTMLKLDASDSEDEQPLLQSATDFKIESDDDPSLSDCENLEEADLDDFQQSVLQWDDEYPEKPVTDEQLVSIIDRMNKRRRSLLPNVTPTKMESEGGEERLELYFTPEVTLREPSIIKSGSRDRARSFDTVPSETDFTEYMTPRNECIRKQKKEELENLRSELRKKAQLKSDHELGIENNLFKENQNSCLVKENDVFILGTHLRGSGKPRAVSLLDEMPSLKRDFAGMSVSVPSLTNNSNASDDEMVSTTEGYAQKNCTADNPIQGTVTPEKRKSAFQSNSLQIESKKEHCMLGSPYHRFKLKRETCSPIQTPVIGNEVVQGSEHQRVAAISPLRRIQQENDEGQSLKGDVTYETSSSSITADATTLRQFHRKAEKIKRQRDQGLSQSAQELQLTIERNEVRLSGLIEQIEKRERILEIEPNNQPELIRWLELVKERDSLRFANEGKHLELLKVKLHLKYRELNRKCNDSFEMADEKVLHEMLQTVTEKKKVEALHKTHQKKWMQSLPRIEDVLRNNHFCYSNFGANYKFTSIF